MATEKRLIDANALIEEIYRSDEKVGTNLWETSEIVDFIDEMPTVEAVEVVHGRWIVNVEFNNGERVIATCSNCKDVGEVRTERNEYAIWHICSPYCPNCGADMRGDDNG